MTVLQVRGLGKLGIIKDVSPTDLADNAFSDGINVRFDDQKVSRAPIFRTYFSSLTGTTPVWLYGLYNQGGFDSVLYAHNDGRLFQIASGIETNVSEGGHVNNVDPRAYTGCTLSQCTYVNRPDINPRVLLPGATNFVTLANWPAATTCLSLRPYKSQLFALNTTEGGVNYSTRVRWSDATLARSVPPSWDATVATNLAGFNELSQAHTPIVDGGGLGDNFMVYTSDEIWKVVGIEGNLLFDFERLAFDNVGLINQNCWVEIDGKHYAWSDTDVYAHDGVTKVSIISQRNREKFFSELNMSKAGVFFVAHDKYHSEILFCGVSGASAAAIRSPNGYCNYAAVYNYRSDTWSFRDLPNASCATTANANTVYTWATMPSTLTWANIGGSWLDMEDSFSRFCMFGLVQDTANGVSVSKIDALDFADRGRLTLPTDTDAIANPPAWVERTGITLDKEGADLRAYKQAKAIMPLVTTIANVPINVQLGAHDEDGAAVVYDTATPLNPQTQYKVNSRRSGRFIATKFTMPTVNEFALSGYDLDGTITGRR
jgi:hypothetical protein